MRDALSVRWIVAVAVVIAGALIGAGLYFRPESEPDASPAETTETRGITGTVHRDFDPSFEEIQSGPPEGVCQDLVLTPVKVYHSDRLIGRGVLENIQPATADTGDFACEAAFSLEVEDSPLYSFRLGPFLSYCDREQLPARDGPTYTREELAANSYHVELTFDVPADGYFCA